MFIITLRRRDDSDPGLIKAGQGPPDTTPPAITATGSDATMAVSGMVIALAVVSVALRFYTRIFTRQGVKSDDWMMLAAVVTTLLTGALLLWGNSVNPSGVYVLENNDPNYRYTDQDHIFLQISLATAVLYFTISSTTKVGILLMYHRIFSVSKAFRYQLWLTGALVVGFWIGCTVATLTSCIPLEWSWIDTLADPRYCFNFNVFWMASGACEIFLDAVVLSLPINVLLRLRLSFHDKLTMTGIFLLGGFVIVTGIVRVTLAYLPGSRAFSYHDSEVWASVHTGMAIVCASLPIFKPLVLRVRTRALPVIASLLGHFKSFPQTTSPPTETSRAPGRIPDASEDVSKSQASTNSSTNPFSVQNNEKSQSLVVHLPLGLPEPAFLHGISFSSTWRQALQERGSFLLPR